MKKIYQKLLLWRYRRLLRKYFLSRLQEGHTVGASATFSCEVVGWLKFFSDLQNLSEVEWFLSQLDSSKQSSQP